MITIPIRSVMKDPRWKRGAEDLYRQNLEGALPFGEWTYETHGNLLSGMVVTEDENGNIARADGDRFRGIMFNHVGSDLDEALLHTTAGVIVGPGRVKVLNKSLDPEAEYVPQGLLTSADGFLAPAAGTEDETAIVGKVSEIHAHAIIFNLFAPTA